MFVADHGKAMREPVAVRFDDGADAAVTGDLEPGQMVITEGQLRVEPGSAVRVLGPSQPMPRLASDRIHPAR